MTPPYRSFVSLVFFLLRVRSGSSRSFFSISLRFASSCASTDGLRLPFGFSFGRSRSERLASDCSLESFELRFDRVSFCTPYSCFVVSKSAVSSRRPRACSLEPPHPAGPPNAVKRSTRKYHSTVTRNWLFSCQGEGVLIFAPHL